jgi:hypothetical protein
LWLPDESPSRGRITLLCILTIGAGVAFSSVQLLATIAEKLIIKIGSFPQDALVIAPHVAGIAAGMSSFLIYNSRLLKRWPHYVKLHSKFHIGILLVISLVLFGAFIVTYSNWRTIRLHNGSLGITVTLGVTYYITQLASLITFLWIVTNSKISVVHLIGAFSVSIIGSYLTAFELTMTLNATSQTVVFMNRFLYLELPPFSTLIACCWLSAYGIQRLGAYLTAHHPSVTLG